MQDTFAKGTTYSTTEHGTDRAQEQDMAFLTRHRVMLELLLLLVVESLCLGVCDEE